MRLDRAAVGAQQHGGEERAALGVAVDHVDVVGVAVDHVGGGAQRLDGLANLLALVERDQRAHAGVLVARVADRDLRQPRADRLDDRVGRWRRARSTRRMAVHFWPAFTVISVTTPLTNRSNSGSSTVTSGPSTEQFSESASTPSCTPPCITLVWVRSIPAVCAEPVNATESCTVSSSSRPAGLPHSSWSAPSGRMPDSTMRRTASSVR